MTLLQDILCGIRAFVREYRRRRNNRLRISKIITPFD